jgi:uncharacterized damage-inducible protein DinB
MPNVAAEGIVAAYRFNNTALPGLLEGIEGDDLLRGIGDKGRCAHWELGHIVASRRFLGSRIGAQPTPADWEGFFSPDSDPSPRDDWPAKGELLGDFATTGIEVLDAVGDLGQDRLAEPVASLFDESTTEPLAHQVAFLLFHESYHVGQVGYIRSVLGLEYLA